MATIKYILQGKSENSSIYLRISLGRLKGKDKNEPPKFLSLKRKTGLQINPTEWSKKTGLPKQTTPINKNITSNLRGLQKFIIDQLNIENSNTEAITGDWLQHQIDLFFSRVSESGQSELVTDAIQSIINEAQVRENGKGGIGLSKSRVNGYKGLRRLFTEFQGNKTYKIKDLNKNKFEAFKKWLLDKNQYSVSYSLKKISDLKTVCKDAKSKGAETSKDLDSIKTKRASTYDDDMDVIILKEQELEQIENTHLINESLINARKWLILACYTGQRGTALSTRVKPENFEQYGTDLVIKIRQKKGNKSVIIPVLPKVKEIYDSGMPYEISMQKLNKYFKEIGKLAGLNDMVMGRVTETESKGKKRGVKKLRPKYQYISTHIGRRSFASNHYGKILTPIIMQVTGHSKESTFLGYINQSDDSHIDTFLDYYKTKETDKPKRSKMKVIKNASNQ